MVYQAFHWATRAKPVPRCHQCDRPLGLGEYANNEEVMAGLEPDYLCCDCAVHLRRPGWHGYKTVLTECGKVPNSLRYGDLKLQDDGSVSCARCRSARIKRMYFEGKF